MNDRHLTQHHAALEPTATARAGGDDGDVLRPEFWIGWSMDLADLAARFYASAERERRPDYRRELKKAGDWCHDRSETYWARAESLRQKRNRETVTR